MQDLCKHNSSAFPFLRCTCLTVLCKDKKNYFISAVLLLWSMSLILFPSLYHSHVHPSFHPSLYAMYHQVLSTDSRRGKMERQQQILPVYLIHIIEKSHVGIQYDCFRVDKTHCKKKWVLTNSLVAKHSLTRKFYSFFFF